MFLEIFLVLALLFLLFLRLVLLQFFKFLFVKLSGAHIPGLAVVPVLAHFEHLGKIEDVLGLDAAIE